MKTFLNRKYIRVTILDSEGNHCPGGQYVEKGTTNGHKQILMVFFPLTV